jgi:uncharacterized membrane protein
MSPSADFTEFTDAGPAGTAPADHEKWWGAVAYLFVGCFLPILARKKSDYVRYHTRQGMTLFFAECIGFLVILIVEVTIGRLPFLGLLIVILVQLGVYLTALALSVIGFVKALFGERWVIPVLGDYSHHIPV